MRSVQQLFIEKQVTFLLVCVKREFHSRVCNGDLVKNIDKMHFTINLEDGKLNVL